jgi:putative endonuclease
MKNTGYVGKLGEDLAQRYLLSKKYKIIQRNFLEKWGEIDLIARNQDQIVFIEVKTVSRSYICNTADDYRPEDNIHLYKTERLSKTIQSYLASLKYEAEWRFDVILIILNKKDLSLINLEHIKDVIL